MKAGRFNLKTIEIKKLWTLMGKYYLYSLVLIGFLLFGLHWIHIPIALPWVLSGILMMTFVFFISGALLINGYKNEFDKVSDYLGDNSLIGQTYFFDEVVHKYALLKMDLYQSTRSLRKSDELLSQKEQVIKRLDYDLENGMVNKIKYETALSEAYEVFDEMLSSFRYGFFTIDTNGTIGCINKRFLKQLNQKPKTIFDFIEIRPEDLDLFIKRDIDRIRFLVKMAEGVVPFYGKTLRVMKKDEVREIYVFIENIEDLNQLKSEHQVKSQIIHLLYELSLVVSGQNNIVHVLNEALEKLNYVGFIKECGIRLYDPEKGLVLKATNGVKRIEDYISVKSVSGTHAGYAFLNSQSVIIDSKSSLYIHEEEILLQLEQGHKIAYIPLVTQGKRIGVLSILSTKEIETSDLFFFESIGVQLTLAIEKIMLIEEVKNNYFKTVEAFVTATEVKSQRFGGHSRRVAEVCKLIARSLYLSETEIDEIYIAGLLHDVGKLGFSDFALENTSDILSHGEMGRQMIERVGLNKKILDGIEHHHLDFNDVKIDHLGYREQPYYAQIIRVANDLDGVLKKSAPDRYRHQFEREMAIFTGEKYAPNFIRILSKIFEDPNNPIFNLYLREDANS